MDDARVYFSRRPRANFWPANYAGQFYAKLRLIASEPDRIPDSKAHDPKGRPSSRSVRTMLENGQQIKAIVAGNVRHRSPLWRIFCSYTRRQLDRFPFTSCAYKYRKLERIYENHIERGEFLPSSLLSELPFPNRTRIQLTEQFFPF